MQPASEVTVSARQCGLPEALDRRINPKRIVVDELRPFQAPSDSYLVNALMVASPTRGSRDDRDRPAFIWTAPRSGSRLGDGPAMRTILARRLAGGRQADGGVPERLRVINLKSAKGPQEPQECGGAARDGLDSMKEGFRQPLKDLTSLLEKQQDHASRFSHFTFAADQLNASPAGCEARSHDLPDAGDLRALRRCQIRQCSMVATWRGI